MKIIESKSNEYVYDHELDIWISAENTKYLYNFNRKGVIKVKDGKLIFGSFTKNKTKNFKIEDSSDGYIYDTIGEINDPNYELSLNSGIYYNKNNKKSRELFNVKNVIGEYSIKKRYRCNYRMEEYIKASEEFKSKRLYNINPKLRQRIKAPINNLYKVGIEYETSGGMIPEAYTLQAGMIPVLDGSLRRDGYIAHEYATVPMEIVRNAYRMIDYQTKLLKRFCNKSINESMHVHVSGFYINKYNIISIYKTIVALQNELYELFPIQMRNTGSFKQSGMNYCSPLRKITFSGDYEQDYKKIYNYLINGNINDDVNILPFGSEHPSDPDNSRKWQVRQRYKIVNMIPAIFGSSKTVEFRIHTPTFNRDKIYAWINIIISIIDYAVLNSVEIVDNKKYPKLILKKVISDMYDKSEDAGYFDYMYGMDDYKDKDKNDLLKYIENRKKIMKIAEKKGDSIGIVDIEYDSTLGIKFGTDEE